MKIISRRRWGARPPRHRATTRWANRREFIVHHTAGPTSQSVRSIQNFHMDGRGWSDIGYNFLVDHHGRIYEGRGWKVVGAHARGHNTSGIGVAYIGNNNPTDAAKKAIRWLYDKASKKARRRLAKRGHGQVNPTSCPGSRLQRWVNAGMPTTSGKDDDDMPDYVSLGLRKDETLAADRWHTLTWDVEYSDHRKQHADGDYPSVLKGPARFNAAGGVKIEGLAKGTEGQVRYFEVTKGDHKRVKTYAIREFTASAGATFVRLDEGGHVGEDNLLRTEVVIFDGAAKVTTGTLKINYWRL